MMHFQPAHNLWPHLSPTEKSLPHIMLFSGLTNVSYREMIPAICHFQYPSFRKIDNVIYISSYNQETAFTDSIVRRC